MRDYVNISLNENFRTTLLHFFFLFLFSGRCRKTTKSWPDAGRRTPEVDREAYARVSVCVRGAVKYVASVFSHWPGPEPGLLACALSDAYRWHLKEKKVKCDPIRCDPWHSSPAHFAKKEKTQEQKLLLYRRGSPVAGVHINIFLHLSGCVWVLSFVAVLLAVDFYLCFFFFFWHLSFLLLGLGFVSGCCVVVSVSVSLCRYLNRSIGLSGLFC